MSTDDDDLWSYWIDPKTKQGLTAVVSRMYNALQAGETPENSAEAAEALSELTQFVGANLECDPDTVTWRPKKK